MVARANEAKFELGKVVATPGALDALEAAKQSSLELLRRHARGDWGEVCRRGRPRKQPLGRSRAAASSAPTRCPPGSRSG